MSKFATNPYSNKSYKFSKGGKHPKGMNLQHTLLESGGNGICPSPSKDAQGWPGECQGFEDHGNLQQLLHFCQETGSPRGAFQQFKECLMCRERLWHPDWKCWEEEGHATHQPRQISRCLGHHSFRIATIFSHRDSPQIQMQVWWCRGRFFTLFRISHRTSLCSWLTCSLHLNQLSQDLERQLASTTRR